VAPHFNRSTPVNQDLHQDRETIVNRDPKGVVRDLMHAQAPFVCTAATPQQAANEYLAKFGPLLGLGANETDNMSLVPSAGATEHGDELRFVAEKSQFDSTTVAYQQTRFGLPVWHGGVVVQLKGKPYQVISSQSTRHADLDAARPSAAVLSRAQKVSETQLATQLGLAGKAGRQGTGRGSGFDASTLKIDNRKLLIYRYAKAKRVLAEVQENSETTGAGYPSLPLPPVPASTLEGQHYVAVEVHFALGRKGHEAMNWTAILAADNLAVLYLRAFTDDVNGMVFAIDPITTSGGPAANASTLALNAARVAVALPGLTPANPQPLIGNLVRFSETEIPTIAAPSMGSGLDFNFDARTNHFAAVNAYYHCDAFFRLMQSMGFTMPGFFGSGTSFPTLVDHRGLGTAVNPAGNLINAHCVGTSGGLGIARTTFALADTGDVVNPIGLACDYRVVLHELGGHGVLYPHVHSPNFGFAHSAGDSVAAITCDPGSLAPDRFVTFPWVNIGRRHDRAPAAGWGWSGNIALNPFAPGIDGGGYNNEQILSTTLFRLYRSMGGDAAQLAKKQFASRFAVYLILRAISSLTPATNPSNAAGFATALINADLGDWTTEGHAGGAYGKVIRWSFEKQGLYQATGAAVPNNNLGMPPPVDVYIDDGRAGEYPYQPVHWNCQAIWNRRQADGGLTHEEPVVGRPNFAYVKIKNRGTQVATGVVVKAFHANPAAGLVYPNDWQPMTTAQLAAPNVAANSSAELIVGPFTWTPTQIGHECMFAVVSANGDPSNINNMTAGDAIPEWRLVPNDNNIGQRNVFPVAGAGGLKGLLGMLDGQVIRIKNPHNVSARMLVSVQLPKFLRDLGWTTAFENPGANGFALKAGELKSVVLRLRPGMEFTTEQVVKAKADATIHIIATANGIVVGGVGYVLDPQLKGRQKPSGVTAAKKSTKQNVASPKEKPARTAKAAQKAPAKVAARAKFSAKSRQA
jgi:zinc metalloprotease ZmpB